MRKDVKFERGRELYKKGRALKQAIHQVLHRLINSRAAARGRSAFSQQQGLRSKVSGKVARSMKAVRKEASPVPL